MSLPFRRARRAPRARIVLPRGGPPALRPPREGIDWALAFPLAVAAAAMAIRVAAGLVDGEGATPTMTTLPLIAAGCGVVGASRIWHGLTHR